ncbi:MAG TPA: acyl-CoA dehydrogenase family protein [Gemmatimonadaceae bacterium]|nr:acyl-CoA dehydrogenase family protein [Gemmatimonadaceae bacterium]
MHDLPQDLVPLVARARDIAQTVTAPRAEEDDREARWPASTMHALAEAGLLGLTAPRDVGGLDGGMRGLVALAEALSRESASAGLCFAMHCVGTAVIAAKATPVQRERYLEPIARGRHITTLALSEPGTGAFFFYPETALTRIPSGFEVTGTKGFVTNGSHADSYVISTAPLLGEGDEGQFNCVLVDRERPGLSWLDGWSGFGMRANDSRTMRLERVPLPTENLLGEVGDQLWYLFEVVAPYFLMAMAGTYLGVAQAAFDEAHAHVGTRRYAHSGELLGAAPVVSHRLGEMWLQLEATRGLVYDAARRGDAGTDDALPSILACKAAAGDAAVTLANEAMTLCGGAAYRDNSRVARILRDSRASHVMTPTTDILKTWLGRALLNLPLI